MTTAAIWLAVLGLILLVMLIIAFRDRGSSTDSTSESVSDMLDSLGDMFDDND